MVWRARRRPPDLAIESAGGRQPHDCRRLHTRRGADVHDLGGQSRRPELSGSRRQLVRGRAPLEGQDGPVRLSEWRAPSNQPRKRRDRARSNRVEATAILLRSTADHLHPRGQAELCHHLVEKPRAPEQRLEQRDLEVRPQNGQGNAGEARPATDIHDSGGRRDELGQRDGVQDVTLPQPVRFSRTDQAVIDSSTSQYVDISPYRLDLSAVQLEDRGRLAQGMITTQRLGSSPSDSLVSPASATASWTILRSNGFIGESFSRSPESLTSATAEAVSSTSSLRRRSR